jgi:hypothetical protein
MYWYGVGAGLPGCPGAEMTGWKALVSDTSGCALARTRYIAAESVCSQMRRQPPLAAVSMLRTANWSLEVKLPAMSTESGLSGEGLPLWPDGCAIA